MARYRFHLHECGTVSLDEDGIECGSLDDVRKRATIAAREVMCSEVKDGRLCLACYIEVRDEADQHVMTVPFRDAIEVSGL